MQQLSSLRGMLTLGYGLEWWASAGIILAYIGITLYFWSDPDEPGFIVMLVLSLVSFAVCYILSKLWHRMQGSAHKTFWTDPANPQRIERLHKLAHIYFGRFNLWITAILGFGVVALAQIFTHRPYEWVIWMDVCYGLCVVLYAVCFFFDAQHFKEATDPKLARRAEKARLRAEKGDDFVDSSDDEDDEEFYGDDPYEGADDVEAKAAERKKLLGSEQTTTLRTYAATEATSTSTQQPSGNLA